MAVGEGVAKGAADELLTFEALRERNGLQIVDRIERRLCEIQTPRSVHPRDYPIDSFQFPVSRAVTIETDHLFVPNQLGVMVRNSLGFLVAEITKNEKQTFPKDTYSLDPGASIKTYIRFDAAFDIAVSAEGIEISLDSVTDVHVGIRSHHKQPAAEMTTTGSVDELLEVISHFGSALKTTSCERSYPTLRGHPPTIKVGESLDIPSIVSPPETGVSIEIPETYRHAYASATLAYYLGADLRPGDTPTLRTDDGFEYPLSGKSRSFEEEVERVLKQSFFLDCITRTEGFFQVNLHERNEIEDHVDLDFVNLYDAPLSVQLESYLDIPYDVVEPHLPTWQLTAHVTPGPEYADTLPFLVNDLAVVRTPASSPPTDTADEVVGVEDFIRRRGSDDALNTRASVESARTPELIRVDETDSLEQAWVGEGAPLGASKAMIEAFQNRLKRSPSDDDIDITVVCNAVEMGEERDLVDHVYGSREELPFDVTIHRELTTDELENVLTEDIDFLHYIGHIDAGGFECVDGRLDAADIDHSEVDVFFLNACTSYEQGKSLIEAGSIAGVVTLQDVINSGAERVGMMLARLLNWGYQLRPALQLARKQSIMGGHYLVIGDGSIEVAQPRLGIKGVTDISKGRGKWQLKWHSYPTSDKEMGSIVMPTLKNCDEFNLISGTTDTYEVNRSELIDYLEVEEMPINYQGDLMWSSDFIDNIV